MGILIEQAVKELTRPAANRIELTSGILNEFSWYKMLDGNKCYWVAKLPIGVFFYVDEARTIKRSGQPDEYIIVKADGKIVFRDETQIAAMNLIVPNWFSLRDLKQIGE